MSTEKKKFPTFRIFLPDDLSKEAFIHWTDHLGKRHRRKGGINRHRTRQGREAAAKELIEKLSEEYIPPLPLVEKMQEWVEIHKGHWKKKTYQTVKSRVDVLIVWLKGRKPTQQLMRKYFVAFASTHHARTHNDHLQTHRRMFKWLGISECLEGIEMMRAISTPAKYFQRHQVNIIKKKLLETDPNLWLACQFIYYCFIRPGELRMLRVGDIHFDEWKICVRSTISKNKKEQYVTVPHPFRPALEHLKYRSPGEFIFYRDDCTKPLGVNTLLNRFRSVLNKLGFGLQYKLYSWKHTGAVAAVKAGISLKELQIQLRHHSLDEVDKYLRQLGVWDLGSLEKMFPEPGEERKNKNSEREIAKLMGEVAKMYPGRGVVEVLRELVYG